MKNYFVEQGNGYPLILLHGNGEDSSYFVHQIAEYGRTYHVFAVDTRGHGKSPRGDSPFSIRQFADDLKAFMDDHSIERAHIFIKGNHFIANKQPEAFNAAVLEFLQK